MGGRIDSAVTCCTDKLSIASSDLGADAESENSFTGSTKSP